MANQYLKPFRDIDPHDVIGLFAYDGSDADKGLIVKIGTGWKNTDSPTYANVSTTYTNTVAQRNSIVARVTAAGSGDVPLGMLLNDVKETDEHGDKYIWNRSKAKAKDISLSGEAVNVATKGLVLYSGVWGTPTAGSTLYTAAGGAISTSGTNVVGKALGAADTDGYVLIKLDM